MPISNLNQENYQEIYTAVVSWINNCDSKATTVLSCIGVIAGIFCASDYSEKLTNMYISILHLKPLWGVLYLVVWSASGILIIVGCVFLVLVLVSHTNIDEFKNRMIRRDSLIFFTTIAENKTLLEYRKKLARYDIEKLNSDYISQIYICSIICNKKFKNYRIGLIMSVMGFILFFIFLVIGHIITNIE